MYSKLLLTKLLLMGMVILYSTAGIANLPITTPANNTFEITIKSLQTDCPKWKSNCKGTIKFKDGSTYTGEISFGQPHGKGTMRWEDGSHYKGEFERGLKQGYGEFTYDDGTKYQGDWNRDKMEGQGAYIWSCGHEYVGDFKNDHMEGQGTILLINGESYSGAWRKGLVDGYGTFTHLDGRKYQGMNKAGNRHGIGMIIWETQDTLFGNWANGTLNGGGIFKFKNGDRLLLDWNEGVVYENCRYLSEDGQTIEYGLKEVAKEFILNEQPNRNIQLAYYSIGLEYQNINDMTEAQEYLQLAANIELAAPNDHLMVAFYLDSISKQQEGSGWARMSDDD